MIMGAAHRAPADRRQTTQSWSPGHVQKYDLGGAVVEIAHRAKNSQ
jgi:hypothetical protein